MLIKKVIVESSNGVTILCTPLTKEVSEDELRAKFAEGKTPLIQSLKIDTQGTALVTLNKPL